MKAAVRRMYGPPSRIVIEKLSKSTPNDDELLVKVNVTTINRTDCANLAAKPFIMRFVLGLFKPRKVVLGTDFAGLVISKGKSVKSFEIGDKVFGFVDTGLESQAEFMKIKEKDVFQIPKDIDYSKAIASLEGAHYAYSFIHKVKLRPKQSILINGASGAIGSALLQFLKQFDVHITATCKTKNTELIKSLGAHKVYDYETEDFTIKNDKYDYIFDTAGKSSFRKCKPRLNKNGVFLSSELGKYGLNILLSLISLIFNKKVKIAIPFSTKLTIPYVSNLLEKGIFNPLIDCYYELSNIKEAYTYVLKGQKVGNVLLIIEKRQSTI